MWEIASFGGVPFPLQLPQRTAIAVNVIKRRQQQREEDHRLPKSGPLKKTKQAPTAESEPTCSVCPIDEPAF